MLLIIAHHYVVHGGLKGQMAYGPFTMTSATMLVFGAWGKTGINCFLMITGYFMCKSRITLVKFIKLYSKIIFYAILFYAIFCISGFEQFTPLNAIRTLFPIDSLANHFVSSFLVFYLVIPFINILIYNMNKKLHRNLLIVLLSVYTVFPMIPKFELSFNYLSWFIVVYLIASYIRLYDFNFVLSAGKWGLITLLISSLASVSIVSLLALHKNPYLLVNDSNQLFPIALAVSSFMFFKNIRIKQSNVINSLAAATFAVLLIHDNLIMRKWLWQNIVDCSGHIYTSTILTLAHAIVVVFSIYIICVVIDISIGRAPSFVVDNLFKSIYKTKN